MFVELDGRQIPVKSAPAWKFTRGTTPYELVLEMDAGVAQEVFEAGRPFRSSLVLNSGSSELVVLGLTILGTSPSSTVGTVKVRIADQRWSWPYKFVARRYNVRRKTANFRKTSRGVGRFNKAANLPADVLNAVQVVGDDIAYAPWSIKENGQAFTGSDVVRDVLGIVSAPGFEPEFDAGSVGPNLPDVEGLDVMSQGDTAVSLALSGAGGGGLDVFVGANGRARVYSVQGGGELEEVGFSTAVVGRPLVGRPLVAFQDNRKICPRAFRILFEKVVEGRVDFQEGGDRDLVQKLVSEVIGVKDPIVPITAFNVFPMPENGTIPAVGGRLARRVVRGTWVTLSDLLAYYNANPAGNALAVQFPLTADRIRSKWFGNLLNAYASPAFDQGGLWSRRIAVIRQHYRLTYRINKPWLDRYKKVEHFRVAMDDPETGARAPSPAFFDYTVQYAFPTAVVGQRAGEDEMKLTNLRKAKEGSIQPPGSDVIETNIDDMNQAPATVTVLDSDLGIVQIRMATDFSELSDRYLRSGTNALLQPFAFGQKGPGNNLGRLFMLQDEELSPEHEVSMVLTFTMGAPNDSRRFFAIDVTPAEASRFLPGFVGRLGPCEGPTMTIRVGAPRAVARFAWNDDKKDAFYETFAQDPQFRKDEAGIPFLDVPDIGDPVNLDQLASWAQGLAAKQLARFLNHPEGALHTDFNPAARIRGTISTVSHEFTADKDGGAITAIELLPEPPAVDVAALVPKDVRRVIEGFVDNPR